MEDEYGEAPAQFEKAKALKSDISKYRYKPGVVLEKLVRSDEAEKQYARAEKHGRND
ncbi:MAG TPA: hypothetical protein PKK26_01300 [Candidatus Wallbacteria bacterium]|nr:hypothetical protein [Candidatus Wallbacteria bacterium]